MTDVTKKYSGMIQSFEADFTLAADPDDKHGLDDLQVKIEHGDKRLLADIDLIKGLSFGIRHGFIKIMQTDRGADK